MSLKRNESKAPNPSLSDYIFGELLGKGTFGTVYKAFKKVFIFFFMSFYLLKSL